MADHDHDHGDAHAHSDAHDHGDDHAHSDVPDVRALRAKALQSLLVDKGVIEQSAIDYVVDAYEHRIGPHLGAAVVAKAWSDPAFRERLLADGTATVADIGMPGWRRGARLVALENEPTVHNVVVCTLCSCYPTQLLGLPPVWYKSAPYRARAVIDPRGILNELGAAPAEDVEVRVWDSTAELRYMVLPERPAGTEGWSEEQLAAIVTRDAMIGVAVVTVPAAGK